MLVPVSILPRVQLEEQLPRQARVRLRCPVPQSVLQLPQAAQVPQVLGVPTEQDSVPVSTAPMEQVPVQLPLQTLVRLRCPVPQFVLQLPQAPHSPHVLGLPAEQEAVS